MDNIHVREATKPTFTMFFGNSLSRWLVLNSIIV